MECGMIDVDLQGRTLETIEYGPLSKFDTKQKALVAARHALPSVAGASVKFRAVESFSEDLVLLTVEQRLAGASVNVEEGLSIAVASYKWRVSIEQVSQYINDLNHHKICNGRHKWVITDVMEGLTFGSKRATLKCSRCDATT